MKKILISGIVVSTIISIILALVLATTTSIKGEIGVLLGIMGTILGMMITFSYAVESRLQEIDAKRFSSDSMRNIVQIPECEADLANTVDALVGMRTRQDGFFKRLAHETLREMSDRIGEIKEGVVRCDPLDEVRLVRLALDNTNSTVRAIAARGIEWWDTPEAEMYWIAYSQAAKRLKVERIFVVDSIDGDSVRRLLDRHSAYGMSTYYILRKNLPPHNQAPLVLFDDFLLHRHAEKNEVDSGFRIEFTDRSEAIESAGALFEMTKLAATPWPAT